MITLKYSTTKDESILDPPQYIQLDKIYNLIIIPHTEQYSSVFNIKPSDSVLINGKYHKVALSSGKILLNNQEYFYFYIAPGFKYKLKSEYTIQIDESIHKLDTYFSSKYSPKILYGLLVLPENLLYLFRNHKTILVSDGSKHYETNLINSYNKYNFYMGHKNNTILDILHPNNSPILKLINQEYQNEIFIRPLYNPNFPLGSLTLTFQGVNYNCGLSIDSDKYSKKLLIDPKQTFTIDNLSFGQYTINLFTKDGLLFSKTITIDKVDKEEISSKSSITNFYIKKNPLKDKANLLINLPLHETFEIKGPDNFFKQFNNGYQYLQNISEGYYTITGKNFEKTIYVIKNDNNYLS